MDWNNFLQEAVEKANREWELTHKIQVSPKEQVEGNGATPPPSESVASELYNAALEALDDDEAHKSYDPNPRLPQRLREALRAWTDMEYKSHLVKHWRMK